MTKKERRKIKSEVEKLKDVVKTIKQYFPELVRKLEKLTDERHQSYVEYSIPIIGITRLTGLLCRIKSMREAIEQLNMEANIKNICRK